MRAVRATFVLFGVFWGTWAVAALDVQRFLGFTDAGLGLLLAATVVGGAGANAFGGVLAERHGTSAVLATALGSWSATLVLAAAVDQRWAFCALFLTAVAFGGLVDVVMNIAGTAALGAQPTRLLRLNAQYNMGALAGAGTTGVLLGRDLSFRVVWVAIAVLAGALAVWVRRADLPAGEPGEEHSLSAGVRALTSGGLRPLAVVFAIGALIEGGVGTWGVTYLRSRLDLAVAAGAGAYVLGAALATTARMTIGWTAAHVGPRRLAQLGLAVSGAGLLLEAAAPSAVLAAVGLACGALGASLYWPMLLSHASEGDARPALVVGGLSACGYVGFLAGPPLVGAVSQLTDLRWGVAFLGVAALAGSVIRLHRPDEARR